VKILQGAREFAEVELHLTDAEAERLVDVVADCRHDLAEVGLAESHSQPALSVAGVAGPSAPVNPLRGFPSRCFGDRRRWAGKGATTRPHPFAVFLASGGGGFERYELPHNGAELMRRCFPRATHPLSRQTRVTTRGRGKHLPA
jgi:hypothetical protein